VDIKSNAEKQSSQPIRRKLKENLPRLSQQATTFINSTTAKSSLIDLRNATKDKPSLDLSGLPPKSHPQDTVYCIIDEDDHHFNKSAVGFKSQSSSRTTTPIDLSSTKRLSSRQSPSSTGRVRKRMAKENVMVVDTNLPVQDLTADDDPRDADGSAVNVTNLETVDLTADSQSQSFNLYQHFDSFDDNDDMRNFQDNHLGTTLGPQSSTVPPKSTKNDACNSPSPLSSSSSSSSDFLIDSLIQPNNSNLTSHGAKMLVPVSDENASKLILLVDNSERTEQSNYRNFFQNVQKSMKENVPVFESVEKNLRLGDFMFVKSKKGLDDGNVEDEDIVTNGIIIERKCVKDIVSRSTSETPCAPHIRQERRLRLCGLQMPFFLMEGQYKKNNPSMPKPLVHADWELNKPDVVANEVDIMRFLAGIVGRNFHDKRVYIIQSLDPAYTALLVAALAAVLSKVNSPTRLHGSNYAYSAFGKFCHGWGGHKKGRQSKLTSDLIDWSESLPLIPTQHTFSFTSEFNERVCRRFGDWPGLITAYNTCTSELHRRLLLQDLSVGGSNMAASFAKPMDERIEQSPTVQAEWEETMKQCSEFLYFYACEVSAMACSNSEEMDGEIDVELKDIANDHLTLSKLISKNPVCCYGVISSYRRLEVQLSKDLHTLLEPQTNAELKELDAVTTINVVDSNQSKNIDTKDIEISHWISVVVSDNAFGVVRRSDYLDVFVISGLLVLETLLQVMDEFNGGVFPLNGDQTTPDVKIIAGVCERLHSAIVNCTCCSLSTHSSNLTVQRLIVFENLVQSNRNHGVQGILNSALQEQESTNGIINPSTPCISLRKPTKKSKKSPAVGADSSLPYFTISSAQRVRSKALWYFALIQAYMPLVFDVQCYLASNAAESKDFVSKVAVEMFRQALLIQ